MVTRCPIELRLRYSKEETGDCYGRVRCKPSDDDGEEGWMKTFDQPNEASDLILEGE